MAKENKYYQKGGDNKKAPPRPYKLPSEGEKDSLVMEVGAVYMPVYLADNFSKIQRIYTGYTKADVDHFKNQAELDYETLARMLHVTKATLFRRGNNPFDSSLSERLMALRDLYSYGYSVMGSRQSFNGWMKSDNVALQRRPIDLTDTLYGISEIKNVLGRIEYGVFS